MPLQGHSPPLRPADPLVTPRLALRPLAIDDLDALHALLVQPGVRRHLCDGQVLSRASVQAMLAKSRRLYRDDGSGLWSLREHVRPAMLSGVAGWWPFRHAGRAGASELLFALSEECWGRGLAMEAGAAMLDYAADVLGWREALASADLGNKGAIRTLWRLGFGEVAIASGPLGPLRMFRRAL